MALPSTGPISLGQVRAELGLSGPISMGSGTVRSLAGVASGPISLYNLLGKSSRPQTFVSGSFETYTGFSAFLGAGYISVNPFMGRGFKSILSHSGDVNNIRIIIADAANPGWSVIYVNNVAYSLYNFYSDLKYGEFSFNAVVPNVFNLLASGANISFG